MRGSLPSCSEVSGKQLVARPVEHFGSEAKARNALEPLLRLWEAATELRAGVPYRFRFTGAVTWEVPAEGGEPRRTVGAAIELSAAGRLRVKTSSHDLPPPPAAFAEPRRCASYESGFASIA